MVKAVAARRYWVRRRKFAWPEKKAGHGMFDGEHTE
jgi:hypothetical protein